MDDAKLMEICERIIRLEENAKKTERDIADMRVIVDDIHEMSKCLALLTEQMKRMTSDVNDLKDEVKNVKEEPANKWKLVINGIITAIVSGSVAFIVSFFK